MALRKDQKEARVEELRDKFQRASVVIMVNYGGLPVTQADIIRRELREVDAVMRAGRNTLFSIAARGTPAGVLIEHFVGQKALVFGMNDPVAVSKVVVKFAKDLENFIQIQGGALNGSYIDASAVKALSELPSREILMAKLLSVLVATPANLVGVLGAIPRKLLYALKALEAKKAA